MRSVWPNASAWLADCVARQEARFEAAISWFARRPTPFPLWNVLIWEAVITVLVVVLVPNEELLIALRIGIVSVWSAVGVIFAPDAWRSMFNRDPTSGQKLVLAVGIGAVATAGLSNISVLWRISPQAWIANSDWTVFFCVAAIFSGLLHCRTPESIDRTMPRKDRLTLGVFIGVGVMLAGVVLVLQPRIVTWVNGLRWLFPDTTSGLFGFH